MLVNFLITCCIIGFVGIFAVSFFFRIRVLTAYSKLIKNRVQFDKSHIFNKEKLEAEVLPKYPQFQKEIQNFVFGIRLSLTLASVLITLVSICAAILMFIK